MAAVKHHTLEISKNGKIINLTADDLAADPVELTRVGRIWYNTTEDIYKTTVFDPEQGKIVVQPLGQGLNVKDEGTQIRDNVPSLNFVGSQVTAVYNPESNRVDVYIPSPDYTSYYNSNNNVAMDCTVPSISTTSRRVANPNGAYGIGAWVTTGATAYPVLNSTYNGTVTFNTPRKCRFDTLTSSVELKVISGDGVTLLRNITLTNVKADATQTDNGATLAIAGFATHYDKFQANINVTLNLATILPNGGRLSVVITHHSDGTDYSKNQTDFFYDPNDTAATIANVDIAQNSLTSSKYLSGLRYYSLNDSFTITVGDIDNINDSSFPQPFMQVSSNSLFGIADFGVNMADLTGYTTRWDNQNASLSTSKVINRASYRYIGTAATISSYWIDWTNGSAVTSPSKSLLIDTYTANSTDSAEEFNDEAKRKGSTYGAWDSTAALGNSDLMVIGGVLRRQYGDWRTYLPANNSTRDYSAVNTNTQYFYRGFKKVGTSFSNGLMSLGGITQANLTNSDIVIWISLDNTNWYCCNVEYAGGALVNGAGCRINPDTQTIPNLEFTFGTGKSTSISTGPETWGAYVRIEMKSGSTVQLDWIRITNWA